MTIKVPLKIISLEITLIREWRIRFQTVISKGLNELGTFEWWISGLMLDPLFFLISRLNDACSLLVIDL